MAGDINVSIVKDGLRAALSFVPLGTLRRIQFANELQLSILKDMTSRLETTNNQVNIIQKHIEELPMPPRLSIKERYARLKQLKIQKDVLLDKMTRYLDCLSLFDSPDWWRE